MVRNGSMVQGAKPRVWVKPWWREMWSVEQNRGFGSNFGGGKCGPGRETAGLGQALVAGNVVQGEKPRVWVKLWWREMWSREQNRGFGSSPAPPQCGPGSKTAGLGQTRPRPSVVQGEKPRVWVKPWWREMWSRERNCGFGPSLGGGKCGPGRETAALGQTRPRRSVVQGAKPWLRVNPGPAAVWSREQNRGFGSSLGGGKCGPGRETAGLGQPRPRRSVVQGEKPRPGSSPAPPQYGPGSKTAAPGQTRPRPSMVQGEKSRPWVKPGPARVWSREQNRGFGSSPAPPECGVRRKTAGLGQARPRRSVIQGEKPRPRVKSGPAEAWSSHLKYKKESKQTYERWIYQSRSDCPGQ